MNGLFVGLTSLDLIYLSDRFPHKNEKRVALDQCIAAGGPATNAAVTFSILGDRSTLLSVIGSHSIRALICADLATHSVNHVDLEATRNDLPPISSIIVNQSTGERAVISINATQFLAPSNPAWLDILSGMDIVLIDGHQMALGHAIARHANTLNIPVVMDGGSWKSGFEMILPYVNFAICSANFYPPECSSIQEVFAYLQHYPLTGIAITRGEKPILYWHQGEQGMLEVPVVIGTPPLKGGACDDFVRETPTCKVGASSDFVKAIDTLGAGDIFHGAFCHFIGRESFVDSLFLASQIAAFSCQYFGTREWIQHFKAKVRQE